MLLPGSLNHKDHKIFASILVIDADSPSETMLMLKGRMSFHGFDMYSMSKSCVQLERVQYLTSHQLSIYSNNNVIYDIYIYI